MESLERETNLRMTYGSAEEQNPKGQTDVDCLLLEAEENSELRSLSCKFMSPLVAATIVIQTLHRF